MHNDADVTTLNITESTFSGNGSVGMRIRGTVDGLTIDGSAFDKNKFGFYTTLGGTFDATNVSNVTITSTTFNDNSIKGIYAEKLDDATFENIEVINSDTGRWRVLIPSHRHQPEVSRLWPYHCEQRDDQRLYRRRTECEST